MNEETADIHLPPFIYLSPLDKPSATGSIKKTEETPTLLMLFPSSLLLLTSLPEKQGKANFHQGPLKHLSNHQGLYVRNKEGGVDFPSSLDLDMKPRVNFYLLSVLLPNYL